PLSQLVGTQLGPYQLMEIIGKGNSGMLFKAHDEEKNRVAAVKVLTPQFTSDDEQRMRFVRAMKTMLPIRDERIVRLYNAGKNGPYCWMAMELVDGENLTTEIQNIGINGMMDWKKVWKVAVDIGRALQTGYDNKIVHRNVTPTNILRRRSDGACLLGDFMFAKALEGTLAQQVTQPGQILGDIPYLAPERTKADAEIDTRSDLYGLGATCYALLTGKPPISGDTLVEMIGNARDEIPDLPKKYQLAVDDLFQDVVMKLLSKDPDQRFPTPSSMLKELLRIGKFNNLDAGL
ncbi:MAG: serine/threonine-protein kinase, partial [Planctomycetota bacterium]